MRSVIKRAQKDWGRMQKVLEEEKAKMIQRVNLDDIRSELELRAKKLEQQVGETVKQLEPTCQKVVEGLRKNAEKVGIDVEKVEEVLKESVATARETLGIVGSLTSTPKKTSKRKSVRKGTSGPSAVKSNKKVAKKVTKKVAKKVAKKTTTPKAVKKETQTATSAATQKQVKSSAEPISNNRGTVKAKMTLS
ncbi:MAG: hypothetical protein AB8C84_03010 [Oligoflexales bacterium]